MNFSLRWLWHARGSNKRDGPQGLDGAWVGEGFSATQAVVLTLMRRMETKASGALFGLIIYLQVHDFSNGLGILELMVLAQSELLIKQRE